MRRLIGLLLLVALSVSASQCLAASLKSRGDGEPLEINISATVPDKFGFSFEQIKIPNEMADIDASDGPYAAAGFVSQGSATSINYDLIYDPTYGHLKDRTSYYCYVLYLDPNGEGYKLTHRVEGFDEKFMKKWLVTPVYSGEDWWDQLDPTSTQSKLYDDGKGWRDTESQAKGPGVMDNPSDAVAMTAEEANSEPYFVSVPEDDNPNPRILRIYYGFPTIKAGQKLEDLTPTLQGAYKQKLPAGTYSGTVTITMVKN